MTKKNKKNANNMPINTKKRQKDRCKSSVAVIRNRNVQFKKKSRKDKLSKKFKQMRNNNDNQESISFPDYNIAKALNVKNVNQVVKTKFQVKTKEKLAKRNQQCEHKTNEIKVKNCNQFKKANNDGKKNKQIKITRHIKNKNQINNDKTPKMKSLLNKKVKDKNTLDTENNSKSGTSSNKLDLTRLKELLTIKQKETKNAKENTKSQSLRERMMTKLKASRFRYLNETLYNSESWESKNYFKNDPDAFRAYHEGYKQQVEHWPLNPLDVIITSIKKISKEYIIADFGCGEAKLAASVPHKVHSFDFVSLNENVSVCDVAHTPLLTSAVHVVVFCLSLMGTNLKDYILEANRVLKKDGILKIAEVESRFEQVEDFIKTLENYGFKNTWKDLSHNLFYFLDFKKENDIGNKRDKLPPITLKPCLYKKR